MFGDASASLVEVALPVPLRQTFSYRVSGEAPPPGTRVTVPFRNRQLVGWVVGKGRKVPGLRDVLAVLEPEPSVAGELLELARWVADYYVAPLGTVMQAMLPVGMTGHPRDLLVPADAPADGVSLSSGQARILAAVADFPRGRSSSAVRRAAATSAFWPSVRALVDLGLLRHVNQAPKHSKPATQRVLRLVREIGTLEDLGRVFARSPRQREAYEHLVSEGGRLPVAALLELGFSRHVVRALADRGLAAIEAEVVLRDPFRQMPAERGPGPTPTQEQQNVLASLADALTAGGGTFLLHGVTASGKTLVYTEFLQRVLEGGREAVVLVPEIALTPQTVARFRQVFGDQVAVLHSGLSDGERFDAWRQLRSGKKRIAIGARSAVFAPVRRLGALIVDEEHDGSYKQSDPSPRYNARDVAVVRAARAGAACVLGSATPSLESWTNAARGKYRLLSLPSRVGGGALPGVRVVDLRQASARNRQAGFPAAGCRLPAADRAAAPARRRPSSAPADAVPPPHILSPDLLEAIRQRLRRKEQTILLLNRRGYASFLQCQECGDPSQCGRCSVSMTYYRGRRLLACHHCGHAERPPDRCGRCGARALSRRGLGTEQVERVLLESVPRARVARMDSDTTGGKWSRHEILGRLREGAVDILLGTQMIAKGHDFPRVTLVGVIDADVGLHLPDFRSCERTFQLLAQVAGRAGRGTLPGEVIIQTRVPDHFVIRAALAHDYVGFVKREIAARSDPAYPPRCRMARLLVDSTVQDDALRNAESLAAWLRKRPGTAEVLGPAPAPIEKRQDRFRWHVLVRGSASAVGQALRDAADHFEGKGAGVRISLDRDPLQLL